MLRCVICRADIEESGICAECEAKGKRKIRRFHQVNPKFKRPKRGQQRKGYWRG
jgi:hypothetical protein